ncbi:MAG: hypothetical protein LLG00_01815 [Planctomycetaceae bacterium]|nr:hypothetical protein [Planctomycetaceae bacterium]
MSWLVFAVLAEKEPGSFWQLAPERLVISIAGLAVLVTIACYVIATVRPKPAKKERWANEWLSKSRDSYSRGELTDDEFRTIKTTLAAQLQDELTDSGEKS